MLLSQLNANFEVLLPQILLPDTMEPKEKQSLWRRISVFYGIDHHQFRAEQEKQYIDVSIYYLAPWYRCFLKEVIGAQCFNKVLVLIKPNASSLCSQSTLRPSL